MFEHHTESLLPKYHWYKRVANSVSLALLVICTALGIGILGYHFLGNLDWVDAVLEASMILGGMGAVAPMTNNAVKLFASAYALFSGVMMVSTTGILLAPWLHRMLHRLYLNEKGKN